MEGHARFRSVPYTAPGEDSPWVPYPGHPFSARGRPAQKPRFGAARAVMQAGAWLPYRSRLRGRAVALTAG
jgi:hypothetical protein